MEYTAPKYYIVKKDIISRINAEEWLPLEAISSERELMEKYNVSRITIRRAVDELVNEGYLYREQGKGTFVKHEQHKSALTSLSSCTEEILRQGMVPTRRVNFAKVTNCDNRTARMLAINQGDLIFMMQRVYFADGCPVSLTTTHVPLACVPGIETFNFEIDSLYRVFESYYRMRISRATRTVAAVGALDLVSEQLEIEEGFPLLLFYGKTFATSDGTEKVVEYFESYYRTDKIQFFIDQQR